MATNRKSSTKAARRMQSVDLGNGKSYTPIRTEDGTMEYELMYCEQFIGFATDATSARERLNEVAYDMERGRLPEAVDLVEENLVGMEERDIEGHCYTEFVSGDVRVIFDNQHIDAPELCLHNIYIDFAQAADIAESIRALMNDSRVQQAQARYAQHAAVAN